MNKQNQLCYYIAKNFHNYYLVPTELLLVKTNLRTHLP